jgi:ribosome-associated protein
MTSAEKVSLIVSFADDMKAERIETLDVRRKTSVADFFVLCTGNSDRHVASIVDRVAEKLREHKVKPLRTEGGHSGWVLQDYGDVIFHVMREEERQFYDLETLWNTIQPDPNLQE